MVKVSGAKKRGKLRATLAASSESSDETDARFAATLVHVLRTSRNLALRRRARRAIASARAAWQPAGSRPRNAQAIDFVIELSQAINDALKAHPNDQCAAVEHVSRSPFMLSLGSEHVTDDDLVELMAAWTAGRGSRYKEKDGSLLPRWATLLGQCAAKAGLKISPSTVKRHVARTRRPRSAQRE